MAISKQQKAFYRTFSQHGSGNALVEISPEDVSLLIHIAYLDLFDDNPDWIDNSYAALAHKEFFEIQMSDVAALPKKSIDEAVRYLELCGATNTNNSIYLYLKNLSELYRRRYKYYHILRTQKFPLPDQIGLRGLLEYGNCSDDLLFSWMRWRKLIYDIDNRSAQETGYLFEPILSSCLGGEPKSHTNSPVRRIDENGKATNQGRQIDCYIEDDKEVYELKLRVTIAASGQGRFSEELSFPYEAAKAGLTPVLIVFDPTPSALLEKLKNAYVEHGGRYAIGNDAWNLLTNKAGKEMGQFILKYIKPPITKMEEASIELPSNISLITNSEWLIIRDDAGNEYKIPRE